MYKLLIAEDNYIQVQSLMNYLNWESYGITEIRTATNGAEGVEIYREFEPDIIIADVSMPVLNGLEMIEKIKEEGGTPKVIYISCYDSFNYISEAIENEAMAYLLKPIDKNKLEKSICKVLKKNEETKSVISEKNTEFIAILRENFMYHMMYSQNNSMNYMSEIYHQLDFDKFSRYMVVKFDVVQEDEKYVDIYQFMLMIKESVPKNICGVLTIERENRLSLLVMSDSLGGEQFLEKIKNFVGECVQGGRESFDLIVLAALSEQSAEFYDIPVLLKQASRVLDDVLTPENDSVYVYKTTQSIDEHYNINSIKNNIERLMTKSTGVQIQEYVERLCNIEEEDETFAIEMIYVSFWAAVQMFLSEHRIALENVFGNSDITLYKSNRFESREQLILWMYNMITALKEYVNKYGQHKTNDVVSKIISYINGNYRTISNIEDIARHCYISSSYARSIFKSVIGKTIFEYLLAVRMDKAQQLLARKDIKVYEVAEMVGYKSKTNFVSAFKKYTGMLPSEFQNKASADKEA